MAKKYGLSFILPLTQIGLLLLSINATAQSFARPGPTVANSVGNLWINAMGPIPYATEHLFLDEMKSANRWEALVDGNWEYGLQSEVLAVLDSNGYPLSIPETMEGIGTAIFIDHWQPGLTSHNGRYRLIYEGIGDLEVGGPGASNIKSGDGWIEFDFTAAAGPVGFEIFATEGGGNHIRDMHVYKLDYEEAFLTGQVHNPLWAEKFGDVKVVRFMDMLQINFGPTPTAEDRPTPRYYSYGAKGISIEDIVALSNELGFDVRICIHHLADTDYTAEIAAYVRDNLNPDRHIYWEWSNEIWNFGFPAAAWLVEQRDRVWSGAGDWMQYGALISGQHMDKIAEVFAGQMGRITRVAGLQAAWPGMGQMFLDSPYIVDALNGEPGYTKFDALAITGYYYGTDDWATMQEELIDRIESGRYTEQENFDWLEPYFSGVLATEIQAFFKQYERMASERGLKMLMYEGGTHVKRDIATSNDAALDAFLIAFNYSTNTANLYKQLITQWEGLEGTGGFNQVTSVGSPTPFGSWGALRHLDDSNPRYDILMDYNRGEFP